VDNKFTVAHSLFCWLPLTMTWVYNQLKYMEKFNSIVIAYNLQKIEYFPWEPLYISEVNRYRHLLFRIMRRLYLRSYPFVYDNAIRRCNPVILHSHFGDKGWYDLPIAKKYKLKHIVTFYGYDVNMLPTQQPIWKKRYKKLFDSADLFLCEGPHMARCLVKLGCAEEKIKVQRLGVEIENIPFILRRIENDRLVWILIVGTFREKKGIPYALEAIGILRKKYPNIRVTVIGDSTGQEREEREKEKILNTIKHYNLEGVVRLLGFQPYHVLREEICKHHIYLSPSITSSDGDTEGGAPVFIIEASASGMPIISTWHCDIPEVIKDGETGILVGERDVEALVKALDDLINDPEQWQHLGIAARQRIENMFDVRILIKDLEDIYWQVLS